MFSMKKQKILCLTVLMTAWAVAHPQACPGETVPKDSLGWTKSAAVQLHFSQTRFDDWAQGGENTWSWLTYLDAGFTRRTERWRWQSTLRLEYGKSSIESLGSRKAGDDIYLESILKRTAGMTFQPYAAVSFRTQLDRGYRYPDDSEPVEISGFMDPAYATQSAGISACVHTSLTVRLGAALKETFTRRHPVPYTDNPASAGIEKSRVEGGCECTVDWEYQLNAIVTYITRLESFANLKAFSETDIRWDQKLTAQLASFVTAGYHMTILYDSNISKKRQIRQILSVGIAYRLM